MPRTIQRTRVLWWTPLRDNSSASYWEDTVHLDYHCMDMKVPSCPRDTRIRHLQVANKQYNTKHENNIPTITLMQCNVNIKMSNHGKQRSRNNTYDWMKINLTKRNKTTNLDTDVNNVQNALNDEEPTDRRRATTRFHICCTDCDHNNASNEQRDQCAQYYR